MTGKELFNKILNRTSSKNGFWHGVPFEKNLEDMYAYFKTEPNQNALGTALGDCCHWVMPEEHGMWRHIEDAQLFNSLHNQGGIFAECENIREVENFSWPDARLCDFTESEKAVDETVKLGKAVLSGTWACFFHNAADLFGMENYFIKMYTDPAVVQAVTERVVDFYLQANAKWFDIIGDRMDAIFFGNDFGSQLDMLISPEMFAKFIMPYFRKITAQAKARGYKVVLHSCGAIESVIPQLINAGVDCLHPIQAKARNMDAVTLARKYGKDIVFMGGVDTQGLLPFGNPQQVYDEVMRLRELFGPNFIVSPSHEAMPNTPPENMEAMARAASY